jgi:cytochrome b6
MDELAYFATKIGLQIPGSIPLVGGLVQDMLQGGPEVTEVTIQRFFALHVVVFPALFAPLLMVHLWLVQKHGNALPPAEEARPETERRAIPFFPNFMAKDLAMWLIALNAVAILASLFPWDLGPAADALRPAPLGIHPEWYFMSQFQVLKVLGSLFPGMAGEVLGMTLFTASGVLWALIPLYDTRVASGRRARRATWLGLVVVVTLVALTVWGYTVL